MSLGVVFGAGGTLGEAYHRGVLQALGERGLDPRGAEVVVGTSAGSIVAASVRRQVPSTPIPPLADRAARRRRVLPDRSTALAVLHRPRQALNALLLTPESRKRHNIKAVAEGKDELARLVGHVG